MHSELLHSTLGIISLGMEERLLEREEEMQSGSSVHQLEKVRDARFQAGVGQ